MKSNCTICGKECKSKFKNSLCVDCQSIMNDMHDEIIELRTKEK